MKILFVSCHKLWNPQGGQENMVLNRLKAFINDDNSADVFYYGNSESNNVQNSRVFNNNFFGKKTNIFSKVFNIVRKIFSRHFPLQSCLFISIGNNKKLKKIIRSNNYDVVVVEMIRLAPLYKFLKKNTNSKLVLELDDIISKRYKIQSNNLLGQTSNENKFFNKLLSFSFIRKIICEIEYNKLQCSEIFYSKCYDEVFLINKCEAEELSNATNRNISWLPCVIDDDMFLDFNYSKYNNEKIVLGFAGLLLTPANMASLENIIDNILPKLNFTFVFKVIGKAPDFLIKRYKNNENIVFTGFVDDFKRELSEIIIFLCPMAFGTGIKTKILEAMACCVPVITNSVGSYGIFANDNELIVIDDNEEIANFINENISNNVYFERIAFSGRNFIKNNFSRNIFLDKAYKIFK